MHYLKTYQKENLHITTSLQQLDGELILHASLHNLSDKPILLRIKPATQSPFTLTFSSNLLNENQLNSKQKNAHSIETFSFLRLEHNAVVAKAFHFSLSESQLGNKSVVSYVEVSYTPFGDGAWGEFPHTLNTIFFI